MSDETAERSSPFAPAIVIGAVLLGFIAFLAWAGLGAFEQDFRNGDDGGAHALSKSAVGYSGLVTLLNAAGRPALVARGPIRGAGLMVLTIDDGDPTTDLGDLSTTRGFDGSILAVLPKWQTLPALHRGWVTQIGIRPVDADTWLGSGDPDEEAAPKAGADPGAAPPKVSPKARLKARLDRSNRPRIRLERRDGIASHVLTLVGRDGFPPPGPLVQVKTGPIDRWQTFVATPGYRPLIVDETGATVVAVEDARDGDGYAFAALSEPDLLNNHGLANIDTARAGLFALSMLSGPSQKAVYVDVTLNGFERARSLIKLMLQPPFLGATLCVLAAALLILWHAIWRFGPSARGSRELAMGKTVLADNQAGLIRMAKREHRMGAGYVAVVRGIVARAVGAPRDLAGDALAAFLDRLGRGRAADSLTDLSAAAAQARTNSDLMDAAQRLHRWRLEMTRESR